MVRAWDEEPLSEIPPHLPQVLEIVYQASQVGFPLLQVVLVLVHAIHLAWVD
jgi:hypothetical protein